MATIGTNNIEFLLAFVCDSNPIIKNSQKLYQIIKLKTVDFPYNNHNTISLNNISPMTTILGLDNIFNRIKGKKVYVSMNNINSTAIYFDNEWYDIHSYVPKIFIYNMNNLNFNSVKYYFSNLISSRFNLVLYYNLKDDKVKCIFEHYDIKNGEDVSDILNNTKHRIECISSTNNLNFIINCFNIDYTEPPQNICYTALDTLCLINVDTAQTLPNVIFLPSKCTVVYIHRFYREKLNSVKLILPPTIKHIVQSENFSFASDKITLFLSKSTNIQDILGIDIQEY